MPVWRILWVVLAITAWLHASLPCLAQSLAFNETAPQFGPVEPEQRGAPKTLSITNVGQNPVIIQAITTNENFAETNNCKMWLAEGSSCLIFVAFTPHAVGAGDGKLTVSLLGAGEQSIPLSGIGLPGKSTHAPVRTQGAPRTSNDEEKAQELLNDKKYSFQDLLSKNPENVARARQVFALTKDTVTKERVASILLSIGIWDQAYFDYLSGEAKKALAHDHEVPWPVLYDEQKLPKGLNPALNEWCKQHGAAFWDMDNIAFYEIPVAWLYFAAAGDPRAYELLIKGLHSQNLMIAATAAKGLAKLGDPRAIDELIATGRQVPGEALAGIVQALVYFPGRKAQDAADALAPEKEKNMVDDFRREMKKDGTRAMLPW